MTKLISIMYKNNELNYGKVFFEIFYVCKKIKIYILRIFM